MQKKKLNGILHLLETISFILLSQGDANFLFKCSTIVISFYHFIGNEERIKEIKTTRLYSKDAIRECKSFPLHLTQMQQKRILMRKWMLKSFQGKGLSIFVNGFIIFDAQMQQNLVHHFCFIVLSSLIQFVS